MKYRDPKTGEVFEDIRDAYGAFNCKGVGCYECVLGMTRCYGDWVETHPADAARLMGLEIITDKEEPMKKDRPRICEVLGGKDSPLEVGEVFTIRDYPNRGDRYAVIHTDGKVHNYLTEPCQTTGTSIGNKIGSNALYWLIEHPESILRQPRFTERDIADMKNVVHILGGGKAFTRWDDGRLSYGLLRIHRGLLPSLRPGQSVRLEDVLREGESRG